MRLGTHPALLKDISEGGLACQVQAPMEEMTRVQIDLELPGGTRAHRVEGAIVYCAPSGGPDAKGYDLGILFLAPPEDTVGAIRSFVHQRLSVEQG